MIKLKITNKGLLLSITKICETLIEQTHRKPREVLEFKLGKSREAFHFNPLFQIKGDWMIGLISLEDYNFGININTTNANFELYTDTFDRLKNEIVNMRKSLIFQILHHIIYNVK